MKKRTKRAAVSIVALAVAAAGGSSLAHTDVLSRPQEKRVQSKDVVVTQKRCYKGNVQYRRWNDTRQYWVDEEWMNADDDK